MTEQTAEKTLLVYAPSVGPTIWVLIPKRRGTGFLKSPVHHSTSPLDLIAYDLGCDFCGLDGYLEASYGAHDTRTPMDDRIAKLMARLSEHYGFPWKRIGRDEFFDLSFANMAH